MPAKSTLYCSFFQSTLRGRQQIWEPVKFSTNLNPAYVSYTQGGRKAFKDWKRLNGVSLPGQQQPERVPSHSYVWHHRLGLYLAAVERRRQEEPREKGACVSHYKTTRTREMAVCRLQKKEKPGGVRRKKQCWHSGVMAVHYGHCSRCGHRKH